MNTIPSRGGALIAGEGGPHRCRPACRAGTAPFPKDGSVLIQIKWCHPQWPHPPMPHPNIMDKQDHQHPKLFY